MALTLEERITELERLVAKTREPRKPTTDPRIVGKVDALPELPHRDYPEEARVIIDDDGQECVLKNVGGKWHQAYAYPAKQFKRINTTIEQARSRK